jgi:hypothetical protein
MAEVYGKTPVQMTPYMPRTKYPNPSRQHLSRFGEWLGWQLAERGQRTRGDADPVVHWLPLGHVEQLDFCRTLIFGETTDPERAFVSVCSY